MLLHGELAVATLKGPMHVRRRVVVKCTDKGQHREPLTEATERTICAIIAGGMYREEAEMVFPLSDPMKDLGLVARHSFVGQLRERLFKLYQFVTISLDDDIVVPPTTHCPTWTAGRDFAIEQRLNRHPNGRSDHGQ